MTHAAMTRAGSWLASLSGSMLANNATLPNRQHRLWRGHGGSLPEKRGSVVSVTTLQVAYFALSTMIGMTLSTSLVHLSSSGWWSDCPIQYTRQTLERCPRVQLCIKFFPLMFLFGGGRRSCFPWGQLSARPPPCAHMFFPLRSHCSSDDCIISDLPTYIYIPIICLWWELRVWTHN